MKWTLPNRSSSRTCRISFGLFRFNAPPFHRVSNPQAYAYMHAAHIVGRGDFFLANGDDVNPIARSRAYVRRNMRVSPANIAAIDEFTVAIASWKVVCPPGTYAAIELSLASTLGLTAVARLDKGRLVVRDVLGTLHVITHGDNTDNGE